MHGYACLDIVSRRASMQRLELFSTYVGVKLTNIRSGLQRCALHIGYLGHVSDRTDQEHLSVCMEQERPLVQEQFFTVYDVGKIALQSQCRLF